MISAIVSEYRSNKIDNKAIFSIDTPKVASAIDIGTVDSQVKAMKDQDKSNCERKHGQAGDNTFKVREVYEVSDES